MLTNSEAFRAQDFQLPTRRLTHTEAPGLCRLPYYSLDTLGAKVATILKTHPSGPPVPAPEGARGKGVADPVVADDMLRAIPAVVDTIAPGVRDSFTLTLPPTTLMQVFCVSESVLVTLKAPDGTVITPNDTSAANGTYFSGQIGTGPQGYRIENPVPGSWTLRFDATGTAIVQDYGCIVEYATAMIPQLFALPPVIYTGDVIRVRAEVAAAGVRLTGVSWLGRIFGPNGAITALTLFDDGAHGDSLAADGVYGNTVSPTDGYGLYRLGATASLLSGESFSVAGNCELKYYDDLIVPPDQIRVSPNLFHFGDSVTVYATIQNSGSRDATGARVDVRDRRIGVPLGSTTITISTGGQATITVPWRVASPDTHEIEVAVSPYVFEDETDYANNVAARTVVVGTPVSVDLRAPALGRLWLGRPIPNPSKGMVAFTFEVPSRGAAALEIFDVAGRRIRRWTWEDLDAGANTLEWDGRGADGAMTPPGLLLCRLTSAGEARSRKVVFRP